MVSIRNAMFTGAEAERYATKIRARVPGYETLHEVVTAWLGACLKGRRHVLVVGAGDGEDLLRLARSRPDWRLTGIDPAEDMLMVARRRLSSAGVDQVELVTGTLADLPPNLTFDAAVAILVSHFVPDDGAREQFFCDLADRVRPGGWLLSADLTRSSEDLEDAFWHWLIDRGLTSEELAAAQARMAAEFHPLCPERLDELLAAAGFRPPHALFQALTYRLVCAQRADGRGLPE